MKTTYVTVKTHQGDVDFEDGTSFTVTAQGRLVLADSSARTVAVFNEWLAVYIKVG